MQKIEVRVNSQKIEEKINTPKIIYMESSYKAGLSKRNIHITATCLMTYEPFLQIRNLLHLNVSD